MPVDRMAGLRSRAIGRDYAPKADSEISWIARHSKRADGQLLLLRENFGRLWGRLAPTHIRAKNCSGLTKQLENAAHIPRLHVCSCAAEIIMVRVETSLILSRQTGQIVCVHRRTSRSALHPRNSNFGFVAQSKQVLGELRLAGRLIRDRIPNAWPGGRRFGKR